MELKKNYIDGEWIPSELRATRKIMNPATHEIIAEVAYGGEKDAQIAIQAAKRSFYDPDRGEWRYMPQRDRARKLYQVADELEHISDELSVLESQNTGMTVKNASRNMEMVVDTFRFYAGMIQTMQGSSRTIEMGAVSSITTKEPIGVCGLIGPWNVPALIGAWKIAPALAAGNSIVFKPASLTPLTTIRIFEVFHKVGFPNGVVNLEMGSGKTVGKALAESNDVDMVTLTGSTKVGREVICSSSGNIKRVGMELGGKSPSIIFADADIESTVYWIMKTAFENQGASWCAGSRVLVEESIHDEFVERLVEATEKLTVGEGITNPDIGAIVSQGQLAKIIKYIESGKKEGAKCLTGGRRLTEGIYASGNFIRPTIFDECTPEMAIVREELLGPIITIQTFQTEKDAIRMANDTEYGLAGGVFTEDSEKGKRVAAEIRAGIIWVNHYNQVYEKSPWGGYKMSGQGRILGAYGLEAFQETKSVHVIAAGKTLDYKNRSSN